MGQAGQTRSRVPATHGASILCRNAQRSARPQPRGIKMGLHVHSGPLGALAPSARWETPGGTTSEARSAMLLSPRSGRRLRARQAAPHLTSQQPPEVVTVASPISQRRTLRIEKFIACPKSHTIRDANPAHLVPDPTLLIPFLLSTCVLLGHGDKMGDGTPGLASQTHRRRRTLDGCSTSLTFWAKCRQPLPFFSPHPPWP